MPQQPSEIFASRMADARREQGWSQTDLAYALSSAGAKTDRSTVNRIEARKRGLSLDDAVLYAAALGPSLSYMLSSPTDGNETVALAPELHIDSGQLRRWMAGLEPLRAIDDEVFYEQVTKQEKDLGKPLRHYVRSVITKALIRLDQGDLKGVGTMLTNVGLSIAVQTREPFDPNEPADDPNEPADPELAEYQRWIDAFEGEL